MTINTCTKVNIGLNVLRKRPDGYHDLETLFVPYWGLGDILTVEPAPELSVEILREGGVDWDPMEDLTVRAWRLLKADFPSLPSVSIRLEKHAPVGAGLGGGSADAAFMLRALNELGGLGLDDAALAAYAAKLGSDCAFFVGTKPMKNEPSNPRCSAAAPRGTGGVPPETPCVVIRPMFATGRGEVLEPFDIDLSGYELRVELPLDAATGLPVAVSTREAYSGIVPRDNARPCLVDRESQVADYQGNKPLRVPKNQHPQTTKSQNISKISFTPSLTEALAPTEGLAAVAAQGEPSPCPLGVQGDSRSALREALTSPVTEWRGAVVNDFEATVCPRHPEIPALIEDFYRRGAVYAAMSGSGSAVFGLFPHR